MNMKFLTFFLALAALSAFAQESDGGLRRSRMPRMNPSRLPAAEQEPKEDAEPSDLNFNQTPLDLVFETYGRMVGKTILKDPATPSPTITLKSEPGQKLTQEEQLEAIEVILEMNGVHLEPYGEKFIRALPRKDVRKEGIPLIMDPSAKLKGTGKVVSMMIPFKNISTEEAQKALEGFKSNSGILLVFERTNSILVTDTEQNINRMMEIVRMIDVATPVLENVFVRQIKHASSEDIKAALEAIVQESQKDQEQQGKRRPAAAAAPAINTPALAQTRLLRRNQPETPAPVNNASLVMSVSDADRGMIRGKVLILSDERSNKLIIVTQKSNMDFFDNVIEQLDVETTPDTVVKVYRLKYADSEEVSDMINDLIGNASSSKSSGKQNQNQAAKAGKGANLTNRNQPAARASANQRSGDAKAGELSKDNTTVLADKRINGLVVMTNKELVPVVESIIESMDVKLSQVLIETVIIEVSLGDELKTGIDWVQRGRQIGQTGTQQQRVRVPYIKDETTGEIGYRYELQDVPVYGVVRDGLVNNGNYMLGGGGGSGGDALMNMVSGVASNAAGLAWGGVNPIGSGVNYLFKSDKLNLAAIIEASKTDSRTKYLASPVVMTVDNKEATINATKMNYLLKGFTSSGNSYSTIAVPDYEQKELGIEIKVTPKINPNGTVMLEVEEKYSQLGNNQEIKYATGNSQNGGSGVLQSVMVPTTVTREMSADVLLDNMQTVVFGGLTETVQSESESGIPILKDIPWIGKWLFGSVSKTESRNELLVFMTPYVLDDGESAQVEALRRKKTLSDSRPWEDHGWSASNLADPVSKKEQMRRLKEEWAKQDEERRTKLAIEKMKVDRAKKLKSLSKEEREVWLKMHKEELEEEEQEKLEEKMLDDKSQEELRQLVEKIKKEKLGSAQKEIDEADAMMRAENERSRLDAEKAARKDEADKPDGK